MGYLLTVCTHCPYRTLGTPNETVWPGVTQLPDFKPTFPKWTAKPDNELCPKIGDLGCSLLKASQFMYFHINLFSFLFLILQW